MRVSLRPFRDLLKRPFADLLPISNDTLLLPGIFLYVAVHKPQPLCNCCGASGLSDGELFVHGFREPVKP